MKYCPECGYEPFYEPAIFCAMCATKLKDKDDALSKDDTMSAEEFKMAMKPFEFERLPDGGINLTSIRNKLSTVASIPYGVTSIGNGVFKKCPNLTNIYLPYSLTSIGDQAFGWCKGKCSADIYIEDLESFCAIDFASGSANPLAYSKSLIAGGKPVTEISLDGGLRAIKDNTFYGFESLKKAEIGEGILSLGEFAFAYCYGLTSVTLPESLTTLGVGVFYNCKSLVSAEIKGGVSLLEKWTFSGCKSLRTLTLPQSLTEIGKEALKGCDSLEQIVFHGTKKQWKSLKFDTPLPKKLKIRFV